MPHKSLFTLFLSFLVFITGCNPVSKPEIKRAISSSPAIKKIRLLPLGIQNNNALVVEISKKIKTVLPEVVVLPSEAFPSFSYYPARNRYRADSLIHWMSSLAKDDEVYVGITNKDISTTKGNHSDWGVMGLGYCPGKACIASSFRLKNKSMYWKVVIHEMGHTAGLLHCKNKFCFMEDAEGGDPTANEKYFCKTCSNYLINKGWKSINF